MTRPIVTYQPDLRTLLTPGREITGVSAILLSYNDDHTVDGEGFGRHIQRDVLKTIAVDLQQMMQESI